MRVPCTGHRVAQDPGRELGEGTAVKTEQGDVYRSDELVDEAQRRKDELVERAGNEARSHAEDVQEGLQDENTDVSTKTRFQNKVNDLKVCISMSLAHICVKY